MYDWIGGFRTSSAQLWKRLCERGVDVRCKNPPRFARPLGWVSRDHRRRNTIDGTIAFVTGLCLGRMWAGDSERHVEPWRDTGTEVRGPAVADIEAAFGDA